MISRVDLSIYYPPEASEAASYLTCNPRAVPGEILMAGSATSKDTIGALVAGKLALEHFSKGLLESIESYEVDIIQENPVGGQSDSDVAGGGQTSPAVDKSKRALRSLEAAFRAANSSVYDFGHKLAAGGRLATTLTSIFVSEGTIAAGRVGMGGAYLSRSGQFFPFFEQKQEDGLLSTTVGSNSIVPVELASVPVQPGDVILVVSKQLDVYQERDAAAMLDEMRPYFEDVGNGIADFQGLEKICGELIARMNPEQEGSTAQSFSGQLFGMLTVLGPETYFLRRVVPN